MNAGPSYPSSRISGPLNSRPAETNPAPAKRGACSSSPLASSEPRGVPTQSRPFLQLARSELLEATARSRPFLQLAPCELLEAPLARSRPFLRSASSEPLEVSARTRPFLQLASSELLEAPARSRPSLQPVSNELLEASARPRLPPRPSPFGTSEPGAPTRRLFQSPRLVAPVKAPALPTRALPRVPRVDDYAEAREARLPSPSASWVHDEASYAEPRVAGVLATRSQGARKLAPLRNGADTGTEVSHKYTLGNIQGLKRCTKDKHTLWA